MPERKKTIILVLICVLLWSLMPIITKLSASDIDNRQLIFYSSFFSMIVVAVSCVIAKKQRYLASYTKTDLLKIFGLSFLGAFICYAFWYLGYGKIQGFEVITMQYTWPIRIVILSFIVLKESFNFKSIVGVLLGFLGVIIVLTKGNLGSFSFSDVGVSLLVLLGSVSFGAFSVLSKKVNYEPFSMNTYIFVFATIFSFIGMMLFSRFIIPTSINTRLIILLNGALINGLSYILWIKALQMGEANKISGLTYLTPILGATWLILLFDEKFILAYGLGFILVLIGGYIGSKH